MTRNNTALIKDLELQIDYLVGYRPEGDNWKRESHIRSTLIGETLESTDTPDDIKKKIISIQQSLESVRNKDKHKQGYIKRAKKVKEFRSIQEIDAELTLRDIDILVDGRKYKLNKYLEEEKYLRI